MTYILNTGTATTHFPGIGRYVCNLAQALLSQLRLGFTHEYNRLVSDPTTIHSLGWRPQMDLTSLARLMLASTAPILH